MKDFFSIKKVTYVAMFAALSYVLLLWEFPIFPQVPILKLDFSFAVMLLGAYIIGVAHGEIIVIIVQLLDLITTQTFGVGQLANFITAQCFVVLPSLIYKFKKGLKWVISTLSLCILIQVIVALFLNRFVLYPTYMGKAGAKAFKAHFWFLVAYNFIKGISNAIICLLLYKKLKKILDNMFFTGNKNINTDNISQKTFVEGKTLIRYSNSDLETISIGEKYAKTLKPGDIVLLSGDLGAGKTTFTKGVAKGLGILDVVLSPTYAYMNNYNDKLYHFDCYRLTSGEDAEGLGLTDYFYAGGICIIEWSENIQDILPKNCKKVNIQRIDDNKRRIEL